MALLNNVLELELAFGHRDVIVVRRRRGGAVVRLMDAAGSGSGSGSGSGGGGIQLLLLLRVVQMRMRMLMRMVSGVERIVDGHFVILGRL